MSDLRVEKGSTARLDDVEGELRVGEQRQDSRGKGKAGDGRGGRLLRGQRGDRLRLSVRLPQGGAGDADRLRGPDRRTEGLDVAHTVEVERDDHAPRTSTSGARCYAGSVSCGGSVRVGGIVEVTETLEAESVEVGGKVAVAGAVKLTDLGVGGKAEVGGGSITGHTTVGGVFASSAALDFGELQVYGRCTLPAGCKGKRLSTFGKLSVEGDLACEQVDVGGVTAVRGRPAAR